MVAGFAAGAALAGGCKVVGQFDLKHTLATGALVEGTNGVSSVVSPQGVALEFSQKDWEFENDALRNVVGAEAAGLRPDESASNKTVRAGVAVVFAEALNVRMAVFTGEHGGVARLANREWGGESGLAENRGPAEGVRTRVNGVEGAPFVKNEWVVYTFVFPEEVPLGNAVLLGDNLTWLRRGFVGKMASLVLIGEGEVSDAALAGVEKAEARRFGVAGFAPATDAERDGARSIIGYNSHNAWASLLILK